MYFVFRHMKEGMWDEDYTPMINFVLMSCYLVAAMCSCRKIKNGALSFEEMADIVRMYSSEVEYSEENMEKLLYP